MSSEKPTPLKSYSDIEITNEKFTNRENWDDFKKFHEDCTDIFYKKFRNSVKRFEVRKVLKDKLFLLTGYPHYGGDLRASDQNVTIQLHDYIHHGMSKYFDKMEENHTFYFVTIVDDDWIFSFDNPEGKFYQIRDRVQRVLSKKEDLSAFGKVELDILRNSHLHNKKNGIMGHAHLVLWRKADDSAKKVENLLQHHFKSEITKRAVDVKKIGRHKDISNIASYISKLPPCAKLRQVQNGPKGSQRPLNRS